MSDVLPADFDQFVKAAGEGCVAAYSVLSYLNAQKRGART